MQVHDDGEDMMTARTSQQQAFWRETIARIIDVDIDALSPLWNTPLWNCEKKTSLAF